MNVKIKTKILDKRLGTEYPLPARVTAGSAGIDLRAMLESPMRVFPGSSELIPTGMAIHIEDPGYAGIILPRSGLGHKQGLILGNGTGLIDSDYQGQLYVSCWNRNFNTSVQISPGDRIAQLIIVPIMTPYFEIVSTFEESQRGAGGFGHTGKH